MKISGLWSDMDVGDNAISVTSWWRRIHYVGHIYNVKNRSLTFSIGNQHLKLVTYINYNIRRQHRFSPWGILYVI